VHVFELPRVETSVSPEVAEGRIEARRYLEALRRDAGLVLAIVAVITVGAVVASLLRDDSYRATAKLALEDQPGSQPATTAPSSPTRPRTGTSP
jgi:uncharacterized protein involved in exopolysaccharide biosynthesis